MSCGRFVSLRIRVTGLIEYSYIVLVASLARKGVIKPVCGFHYVVGVHVSYSGTSLLRSPTDLVKSNLNGEVTLLQGIICTVEYNLGLSQGDGKWAVFLLVK